jgi:hypothetical protein
VGATNAGAAAGASHVVAQLLVLHVLVVVVHTLLFAAGTVGTAVRGAFSFFEECSFSFFEECSFFVDEPCTAGSATPSEKSENEGGLVAGGMAGSSLLFGLFLGEVGEVGEGSTRALGGDNDRSSFFFSMDLSILVISKPIQRI